MRALEQTLPLRSVSCLKVCRQFFDERRVARLKKSSAHEELSFTEEELAQKELGSKRVDPLHLGLTNRFVVTTNVSV